MKKLYVFTRKLGLRQLLLICLATGLALGTIFANLFKDFYMSEFFLFNDSYMNRLQNADLDRFMVCEIAFVDYIKEFGLLILLCTTVIGKPYILLNCMYKGFGLGFVISTATMRFGWKGILFFVCYISPQCLIYIPLLIWTYLKGYELNCELTGKFGREKISYRKYLPFVLLVLLMIVLMSLLEGYINTSLLRMIMVKLVS